TALREMGLPFISRCPDTFGAVAEVKAAAWAADNWETVGTVAERRNAASYWASEHAAIIGETTYRFIVYRSSALDNRKATTLDREIAQARDTLTQAAQALHRQTFQCEADAQTAAAAFQQRPEQQWFQPMPPTIAERTERVSQGRGRPRKDAPVRTIWTVSASIGADDGHRRHAEWERRSTFALITTLPRETWDARAVLQEYKGQVVCERKFHFMKDPLFINALFLKTPKRLEALGYVVLMAALLYSLLERRLRDRAVPIPSPSRRVWTRPTAHELFRHLRALQVTPQPDGSRTVSLPEPFHATFWAFLKVLRLPERYFTEPPPPAHSS
ncbi:MAG: transposase, partial [Sulfobacillus thermosulfidooxidans]